MGLLDGKRAVVVGIANKRSIAWGIAKALDREGAQLILTYQIDRFRENLEKLAGDLTTPPVLLALDVAEPDSLEAFTNGLATRYHEGGVDILVHSIANAHREDLEGRFVDTSRDGFVHALEVSAYSLPLLTRAMLPFFEQAGGGSVMTMTYQGSERVMPNYNIMGVAKAALESAVRYLAYDLGRERIRVNAISAGPVKTLAMAGVKGGGSAIQAVAERAPIPENITTDDVGNAAVFLASDWARLITGQILFVDSGSHIMGH
jgi:enoyl-[acyl-carrier protein] reductase I